MREGFRLAKWGLVAQLALLPAVGTAQRPPTIPINLGYFRADFIQPGARPAALGGAFIGAAQDEIAAAINPAGLTYLKTAGASLHLRAIKLDGRFDSDQFVIAAFFPIKRFCLAFSRQVLFNSRFEVETLQQVSVGANPTPRLALGGLGNFPGTRALVDFHVFKDRWSLAYRVSNRMSVGFTASNFTLDTNLREQTFLDAQIIDGLPPRGNIPETLYSTSTLDRRDGLVWGYSIGWMATVIPDRFFVGAVIDFNPGFDLSSEIFLPEHRLGGVILPPVSPANNDFKFSIPDVQGIGIFYRATKLLHLTFDVVRREYQDMLLGNSLNIVADDELDESSQTYIDPDGRTDLTISNAIEVHFGVERLLRVVKFGLIPLRFGFYTSPAHRIHAQADDADLRRLFPQGPSRAYLTFGTGIVGSKYYKYDIGANFSSEGWQLFFSATFKVTEF